MTDYSDEAVAKALAILVATGPVSLDIWQKAMSISNKRERKDDNIYSASTVDLEKAVQQEAYHDTDWESVKYACQRH
jgi:predicted kinase|tara:strand:- start:650 stop:880 length:231 start_codon:yes stop_codon:yes gene_type:complete